MRVEKVIRMTQRITRVRFFSVFSSAVFTLLFSLSAWSSNLVIEITQGVDNPVPIQFALHDGSLDQAETDLRPSRERRLPFRAPAQRFVVQGPLRPSCAP